MYDYIFVVLAYRNMNDLEEMIDSVKQNLDNYRIVVVNSYFDEESKKKAEYIAQANSCDFINVENKGYSYGNNVGIEYAFRKYDFKYIVVANPDIIMKSIPKDAASLNGDIVAPCIIARTGKKQNPMIVKKNPLAEWLIYQGFKKENKLYLYIGIGINRMVRELYLIYKKQEDQYPIYCAHGSCVFISQKALDKIGVRPYDENIFLFAEESVLAECATRHHLTTVYNKNIVVHHKEDGSMKLAGISINSELSKANIYFYERYRRGTKDV